MNRTEKVTIEVVEGCVAYARHRAREMGIPEREFWIVLVAGGIGLSLSHEVTFVKRLNEWRNAGEWKGGAV